MHSRERKESAISLMRAPAKAYWAKVVALTKRRIVGDALWVAISSGASAIIALVNVRIVSRMCDAASYGEASLVLGVVTLISGFVLGALSMTHLRLIYEYKARGMSAWFASAFGKLFKWSAGACAGLYIALAVLSNRGGASIYRKYAIAATLMLLLSPYLYMMQNRHESARDQRRNAAINILQQLSIAGGTVLLLKAGVAGGYAIIYSQLAAIIFPIIFLGGRPTKATVSEVIVEQPKRAEAEARDLRSAVVKYGWSVAAGRVASWVASTSDRYLIEMFMSIDRVGVYTLNYGLWSKPYLMLSGVLELASRPVIYQRAADGKWSEVRRIIRLRLIVAVAICLVVTPLLYVLTGWLSATILSPQYAVEKSLILWLLVGHVFFMLGGTFMSVFLAKNHGHVPLIATSISAVANGLANFVMIPRYGLTGAAAATAVSYAILAAVMAWVAHRFLAENCAAERAAQALTMEPVLPSSGG